MFLLKMRQLLKLKCENTEMMNVNNTANSCNVRVGVGVGKFKIRVY